MLDITRPTGQFDAALLMSEIETAVPSLLPQDNELTFFVEAGATGCRVSVPDDTSAPDLATVNSIIDAHDSSLAAWGPIRDERNRLLAASDWTQLTDIGLSQAQQRNWQVYRQALRDITNYSTPADVVWPIAPE